MRLPVLAAGLFVMAPIDAVQAVPMTLAYSFVASSFQVFGPGAAPVDPVTGSFNLTFDPSKPAQVTDVGLSVTGLNIVHDGIAEYGYTGVFNDVAIGDNVVFPGGHSVGGLVDPLKNDFSLYLSLRPVEKAVAFTYSQSAGAYYVSENVVLIPTMVDEPASLALLGSFMLSLGVVLTAFVFQRR